MGEARAVRPVLERMSRRARYAITLNSLLQSWEYFTYAVERGYNDELDEYLNDLSARSLLQELMDEASADARTKIEHAIAPDDERFRDATEHLKTSTSVDDTWWRARIPRNCPPELPEGLRAKRR